jgi:hypothetical protein
VGDAWEAGAEPATDDDLVVVLDRVLVLVRAAARTRSRRETGERELMEPPMSALGSRAGGESRGASGDRVPGGYAARPSANIVTTPATTELTTPHPHSRAPPANHPTRTTAVDAMRAARR